MLVLAYLTKPRDIRDNYKLKLALCPNTRLPGWQQIQAVMEDLWSTRRPRKEFGLQWFFLEYKGLGIEGFLFWSWMQFASIHNFIILSRLTPWLCCLKELLTNDIDQSLKLFKSMILFNTIIFSPDWTNQLITKTRAIKNQIIGKSEVMKYLKLVLLLELRVQDHCNQVWTSFFFFQNVN